MTDDARNLLGGDEFLLDLEKLLVGLGGLHRNQLESSFHVVQKSVAIDTGLSIEALVSISKRHHIHKARGEARIRSDGSVDLNETLHADHLNLSTIQRELQSVS